MCSESIPVIATMIVAVLCTSGIVFSDFSPSNDSQGNGSARMITAAAVAKARRNRDSVAAARRPVGVLSNLTIA
jgi:hypothetical protein